MSKTLFLFLVSLAIVCCFPRRQTPNFNEPKLVNCLNKEGLQYDENMKELRHLFDALRTYLFNKKFEEYGYKEEVKEKMEQCFKKYGINLRMVSPYRNCLDICEAKNPGQPCHCPHY